MINKAIILKERETQFHLQTKNPAVLKNLNKYTQFQPIYCPVKFIN